MRGRVESEPFQLLVLQSQHVNVRLLLLDNVILENFVRVDDRLPLYLVRTTVKFVLIILRVWLYETWIVRFLVVKYIGC